MALWTEKMRCLKRVHVRLDEIKMRTVYTYWQPPQSLQRVRAGRQMSEKHSVHTASCV